MTRKRKQPALRVSVTHVPVADYQERLGKLMKLLLCPTAEESANKRETPPAEASDGNTLDGGAGKDGNDGP